MILGVDWIKSIFRIELTCIKWCSSSVLCIKKLMKTLTQQCFFNKLLWKEWFQEALAKMLPEWFHCIHSSGHSFRAFVGPFIGPFVRPCARAFVGWFIRLFSRLLSRLLSGLFSGNSTLLALWRLAVLNGAHGHSWESKWAGSGRWQFQSAWHPECPKFDPVRPK